MTYITLGQLLYFFLYMDIGWFIYRAGLSGSIGLRLVSASFFLHLLFIMIYGISFISSLKK